MHRISVFLLLCCFWMLPSYAQKYHDPTKAKNYAIIVNAENETVNTQVLRLKRRIKPCTNRTYYWYSSQKITETVGGFGGKLLHGTYTAFYLNDQLKEKGNFYYGLKNKCWKCWYPDGKLKEVITWKKGRKHGYYALYNDFGELMAEGNFRNDKLNGTFTTYGAGHKVLEKKKYKNGTEQISPSPETPKDDTKKSATTT